MTLQTPAAGEKFGRLVVIGECFSRVRRGGKSDRCVPVECECGTKKVVVVSLLYRGKNKGTRSCGCLVIDTTIALSKKHGDSRRKGRERLHITWASMRERCVNPNSDRATSYHDRGIKVCPEWDDYNNFREWALANGYRKDLTIERIDVNGNYEPSNCTWITKREQHWNKRNTVYLEAFGERKSLREWLGDPRCIVKRSTIRSRLKRGWESQRAMTEPLDLSVGRFAIGGGRRTYGIPGRSPGDA